VPARDADVAADALADVLLASLVDLARQERVGDRGPRGADEIEHPTPDLTHHGVGGGEAADADHGFAGELLHELDDRLVAPLGRESRRGTVGRRGVELDVPEVRQIREKPD